MGANFKRLITNGHHVDNPPIARTLFENTKMAWLWLPLRLWLGYQWIDAAMHKINNPAWVQTGDALKGFWESAVAIPAEGRPAISFDWYRGFLQSLLDAQVYTWFGKLIAYGELLIGIALILGAFTGIAAFFGALMNMSFLLAGSASTNPVLFTLAVGLMLAWRVAGYYGLDRYLLPALGAPWRPGAAFRREAPVGQSSS